MSSSGLSFLRPYLSSTTRSSARPSYARLWIALQRRCKHDAPSVRKVATNDAARRIEKLSEHGRLDSWWPIYKPSRHRASQQVKRFFENAKLLKPEETSELLVNIRGRVTNVQFIGSKLIFIKLKDGEDEIQALVNRANVTWDEKPVLDERWDLFRQTVRKGDYYTVTGHAAKNKNGQVSVKAMVMPKCLAPSLHQLPTEIKSEETLARQRHVDLLMHPHKRDILMLRHRLIQGIHSYLSKYKFVHVNTPILTANAGGAAARPFETTASEFPDIPVNLRIAPELYLKRLVVGGLPKVYELGSVFRNEGIDLTHNPEFTIAEFYEAYTSLTGLMGRTRQLLLSLDSIYQKFKSENPSSTLQRTPLDLSPDRFDELMFIPTIEAALGETLPDLTSPTAREQVVSLFHKHSITTPSIPTLPRLLDTLSAKYIEPQCQNPTFITHHPEIMSPLSKSITDPHSGQRISKRAELFIAGREYANMYEEENNPFEQRRKFEAQLAIRAEAQSYQRSQTSTPSEDTNTAVAEEGLAKVDENYIEALEWGLPPTGGWGCGVDRLVMLFAGTERIADVLAFGTLRNVVSMREGVGKKVPVKIAAPKVEKGEIDVEVETGMDDGDVEQLEKAAPAMPTTSEVMEGDRQGTEAEIEEDSNDDEVAEEENRQVRG